MFEGRYDVLFPNAPPEAWEYIYVEYIDLSGLADTPEYRLITNVLNLNSRLRAIPEYVKVQLGCIEHFGEMSPTVNEKLAKKGYAIPADLEKAKEALLKIPGKEKLYDHRLKEADAALKKLRGTRVENGNDSKRERRKFIQMLNSLGTTYRIDRDKTTVEELAAMVRENAEQRKKDLADKFAKS